MGVGLYVGISKDELNAARTTSEGKQYTINHPEQLTVQTIIPEQREVLIKAEAKTIVERAIVLHKISNQKLLN